MKIENLKFRPSQDVRIFAPGQKQTILRCSCPTAPALQICILQFSFFNFQFIVEKDLEPEDGAGYSSAMKQDFRESISQYIRAQAKPPDKFSHQPRLYRLAASLAAKQTYDDDVVFAAAWMHDLGVFVGHRPDDPAQLSRWDHLAYAMAKVPAILAECGFPREKIPAVVECIRTHMPDSNPTSFEGTLLRDADILEQLGTVGILRTVSKVGRDTRFISFADALRVLRKNAEELPQKLRLDSAKREVRARLALLQGFLKASEQEASGIEW
jgi:uncharacterized protein